MSHSGSPSSASRSLLPASIQSVVNFLPNLLVSMFGSIRSKIYDSLILHMTTKWYEVVLGRVPEGSTVLDIGIGTAGALVNCRDLLKERKIRVVGLDYDPDYVVQAKVLIEEHNLEESIQVIHMSVYDMVDRRNELKLFGPSTKFDAAYFSGSFSLLPDMCGALKVTQSLLELSSPTEKENSTAIYITQTYQRKSPPFLSHIKPLLRYLTTIDFGKLIMEADAKDLFETIIPKECALELVEHEIIPGSLDTSLQAAYLTILKGHAGGVSK